MAKKLAYHSTDTGYCRVYYTWLNSEDQTCYYCIQDEGGGGMVFYRCTDSPWCEPDYPIKPYPEILTLSPGNDELDIAVNKWITNKLEVTHA